MFFILIIFFFFYFFFFSSRRRHTRLTCDWSSDVCSSDLNLLHKLFFFRLYLLRVIIYLALYFLIQVAVVVQTMSFLHYKPRRSEERRVGKECRYWWWRMH